MLHYGKKIKLNENLKIVRDQCDFIIFFKAKDGSEFFLNIFYIVAINPFPSELHPFCTFFLIGT